MFNFTVCLFLKKSFYIRELTFKLEEKFKIEMYKVEKLKSFLDCEQCKKLLVDPVLMACGKFICKLHLDKMLTHESKEENTFICEICQGEHFIPKDGFVVPNRLQDLLDIELNKFAPSPMFEECRKEIENAKESLVDIGLLEKNAENYIYEYFEDVKRLVDIRREDLKFKIDTYSDQVIKSVEMDQMNLIKLKGSKSTNNKTNKTILAGSHNFQTDEIEVFVLTI